MYFRSKKIRKFYGVQVPEELSQEVSQDEEVLEEEVLSEEEEDFRVYEEPHEAYATECLDSWN